jgi:low temperature requirement protein LtrA
MATISPSPWISPPRLRTLDEDDERHATWLELFFDLVFVAAVAQIATTLDEDHSAVGFAAFVAVFIPVAWAWMGFTFYANRFDSDDVIYRAMKSVAMIAVAALAVNSLDATGAHADAFALSYVAVRAVLIALYVRAHRHVDGAARKVTQRFIVAFSVGALLWLASAFVPEGARFFLWGAGLAVELAAPLTTWRLLGSAPIHAAHIEERFGLFTIIVLGEAILAVVIGVKLGEAQSALAAVATLVAALGVWWIYFDFADTSAIREQGKRAFVYVYGHLALFAGVAAFGVGAKLTIGHAGDDSLDAGTRWALCGGLATFLLCLAVFHTAVRTNVADRVPASRVVAALTLLALALAGGTLPPLALAAILTTILVVQLVIEATYCRECAPLVVDERPLTVTVPVDRPGAEQVGA